MKEETPKKWWMLAGIGLGGLIVAIDFTIVNTVLPLIQHDLSTTMNLLQWVMTGFGITFASLLITSGRLGDLLGHRLILLVGILGFGAASLGAGLSTTIHELIVSRILQGIFASTVFPCGAALIASVFPQKEQGRALGMYGSILGIGLAVGPVLGGFITSIANWRWIFLINLPIISASFILCILVAPEVRAKNKIAIDWLGMLLVTSLLALLVFAITQSQVFGLSSPYIFIPFFLSVVFCILFILIERKVASPLLPFAILNNRPFFISAMVYSICVGLPWSIIFFVPLYLQTALGLSEMQMGLLILPMTLMTVIAPIIAGYLFDHQGPYLTTMLAFIIMIVGLVLSLFFTNTLQLPLILLSFISMGLSWGIANGIAMPLALYDPKNQANEGVVSGVAITILNIFGIVVLSISTALFHHIDHQNLGLVKNDAGIFLEAFHYVMGFLLILAIIGFIMVLPAFKHRKKGQRTI